MDFRKLTDDLNIISALGDNPNADNALTPSGLKAKFDEAALKIKHYLNEVLIPDLYTAVESEEFRGQPGLSPTVEAERFQDSTGSGVKLVITTPAPPDSGLLDSVISIPLYDGENGVTPKISNVDIEVLEYGADASAEITGPTNNLNLLLKIPRGETGRTGDTPFIRTSGIAHTDGRHGTQFAIYASQSAVNPSQTVTVYDGKDGEKGDPGKSPTVTVTKKRLSDGRMEATIGVINVDGSSQSATVTDGKNGENGRPDWNQNDPTAPDYIANRTHYEYEGVQEASLTADVGSNFDVAILDKVYEQRKTAKYNRNTEEYFYDSDVEGSRNFYISNGEDVIEVRISGSSLSFRLKDSFTVPTVTITYEEGVTKIRKIDEKYLPDKVQPDWNQNDPTAPDYIKNRPFYDEVTEGEVTITIKPNGVVEDYLVDQIYAQRKTAKYEISGYGSSLQYWFDCEDGTDDYLLYDGVNIVRAKLTQSNGIQFFKVANYQGEAIEAVTVSIAFVGQVKNVHKLDPKYLPDSVTNRKPYVIDSEAYTYGDDALAAILSGRQILVKVPNKNTTNTLYSNFMPVLQYQLPNNNNDYLILFYLKDGIAENLLTALQAAMQGDTSAFDGVYGVIEMMLSQSYAECPLKVSPIK